MRKDVGRLTGSREPDPQAVPALSGFDPGRECNILDHPELTICPRHGHSHSHAPLSRDQIDLLAMCPGDRSFVAADIPWSLPGPTGNALNRLAKRGVLIQATDPEKWGRSRYIADPVVVARAIEAQRATTPQSGVVHESAVAASDLPKE